MNRTDERRRRQPQAQTRRPAPAPSRKPPGRPPGPPPQRRSGTQPPRQHRREEPPVRSGRPTGQRSERRYEEPRRTYRDDPRARQDTRQPRYDAPRDRQYAQPRREAPRAGGYAPPRLEAPKTRYYEEPPRRRPPQQPQRRRSYDEPVRRPAPRRQREEIFQPKGPSHVLNGVLVILAAMVAVFCINSIEQGGFSLGRKEQVSVVETVPPTEAPTDAPTEAPTRPPVEVTPISSLEDLATLQVPDFVDVQIIDLENTSRRGAKLWAINDIVLHYVGNPGSTAKDNRDWYAESNCDVNSHFVVGLQGEIIQCVPLDEKSSASNHRNGDTISIEICHPDESGKFTDATYNSVVELVAWLVKTCNLDIDNVIRHYEVTGKICPKYYVENDDAWAQLRADVQARMGE